MRSRCPPRAESGDKMARNDGLTTFSRPLGRPGRRMGGNGKRRPAVLRGARGADRPEASSNREFRPFCARVLHERRLACEGGGALERRAAPAGRAGDGRRTLAQPASRRARAPASPGAGARKGAAPGGTAPGASGRLGAEVGAVGAQGAHVAVEAVDEEGDAGEAERHAQAGVEEGDEPRGHQPEGAQ